MAYFYAENLKRALAPLRTATLTSSTAVALVLGGIVVSGAGTPVAAQSTTPSSITVVGNQRIASSTILTLANLQTGTRYSAGQLNAAVQRLNASGFFKSVDFTVNGGRITIDVVENPTISRIAFEGNKKLKDDALSALVSSQSRQTYSATRAEQDANEIATAYSVSGRVLATVTPKIIERSDNRVDLVFQVVEGRVTEIENITFTGNRKFSERRLRAAIATKQAGLASGFSGKDTFIEDRLELDKQNLRSFYQNRGYIDFTVNSVSADLTRERDGFLLAFDVTEGQQYYFGDIELVSNETGVDVRAFEKELRVIKSGRPYDPRKLENLLQELDAQLADARFPFVTARPNITRNEESRTLDVVIDLARGQRVFVERIDIEGNSTTLDRVVRSKFELAEGDAFNQREIQKATDRIRATGYFGSVDVQAREGSSPQSAIIDVDVEEQPTGDIGIGGSYSSSDGVVVNLSVEERNFLGRGQTLRLGGTNSSDSKSLDFGFHDPSFLDRNVSAGIDITYNEATPSYIPIETERLIIRPSFGFPVGKYSDLNVAYKFERESIAIQQDDDGVELAASPTIQDDVGELDKSSIILRYNYDRRNSIVAPTGGYQISATQEFAGLGGDAEFSKTSVRFKTFSSLLNEQVVLSAELEGGYLHNFGSGSRVTDRFFLGGGSLRGFDDYGIGPREDGATGTGDPLGGNAFAVARLEASFPVGLPEEYGIFGGVFLDAGSVWELDNTSPSSSVVSLDKDLRVAAGVSIFWETPIGPLRFDFSRPLKHQEGVDVTEDFRFSIQTRF
ncbi:outer membrane protein assembly factor BamA [Amylibacter marinus]|uniref:Outer membrane protein assembly factor BamA n=1 Tax=Amylibacter marinus TaxID=1475483 RepID=A0ABQ5VSI9_9RHOB|nr:outer membrane protein assembly factor BamA [Amylibacter marinus]GLQ34222.1 outer membrane protein assembly factor BamA [Amylibacter marinus]